MVSGVDGKLRRLCQCCWFNIIFGFDITEQC